jgi:hypothetical protein
MNEKLITPLVTSPVDPPTFHSLLYLAKLPMCKWATVNLNHIGTSTSLSESS